MKIKILSVFTILVATLFFSGLTINAQETIPDLSQQIEFRKEFGLETDIEKIKLLNKDIKLQEESNFEVPLTKAEEKKLEERFKIQNEYIPKIKRLLDEKYGSENFTLYINQENQGEIVIKLKKINNHKKTTAQKNSMINELKGVGPMFSYAIEDSTYSETDLNNISEQIWKKKGQQSLDIDSTSVDVINEKVIVGIINYTLEKEQTIKSAYEDFPLEVIQIDSPDNHRSAYGGEKISNNRGYSCSAGYYAKSGNNHYLITAGHCSRTYSGGKATLHYSDTYKYGTTTLGKVSSIRYGGSMDALSISVGASNANSNVNINGAVRKMTSSQARNGDTVGQSVCRVGYASGKSQCGTLKSKNVSYSIDGASFSGLRGSNLSSTKGDSGGTVYNSFQYLGITKGTGGGHTHVYSQIGNINAELGLSTYLQ